MNNTGWDMEPLGADLAHVVPTGDLLMHEYDDCACLPTIEPHERDDGSFGWIVIHQAWDGRQ